MDIRKTSKILQVDETPIDVRVLVMAILLNYVKKHYNVLLVFLKVMTEQTRPFIHATSFKNLLKPITDINLYLVRKLTRISRLISYRSIL